MKRLWRVLLFSVLPLASPAFGDGTATINPATACAGQSGLTFTIEYTAGSTTWWNWT